MALKFRTNCINSTAPWIIDMVDGAIDITRRTFLQHVDRDDLAAMESALGYADHPSRGLTMAADWHVSYHRSKYRGRRCYYFRHSAIEYIFC
jgi:hypothetical protein